MIWSDCSTFGYATWYYRSEARRCESDYPMALKLLIVETEDTLRQTLFRRFADDGLKVYGAGSGSDAERIVRERAVDVVIVGLLGMGREGLVLLKNIKEMRPLTEVILIAGHEQLALSIEGMKLGAFDDFRLPIDMNSLTERVYQAGEKKKAALKAKKGFFRERFRDIFVAATFAEAGEFDLARQVSESKLREPPEDPKKSRKK